MASVSRYLFALLVLISGVAGYRKFQEEIPNGDEVPHPCKPNYLWRGVGHVNPLGGGDRNSFGKDFVKYKKWTTELCRLDSDGDGMTNGQELGDPDCTWSRGSFPTRNKNITHPGVCDPWGSDRCSESNRHVTCETGEFVCDSINSPDVFNITLRFPKTPVPPEVTTYMCMTFDLDMLEKGVDYHLIAFEPLTDNVNVMHHTDLYMCDQFSEPKPTPEKCYMTEAGCTNFLSTWVLGLPGQCFHKNAGFRMGGEQTTRIMLQHHWNNPDKRSDYIDGSGMILYMTRKLRPNDAGLFITGQNHLVIPPGQSRVATPSTCTPECTRLMIKEPIYFLTGLNHMHYLGYTHTVEQFRDGVKIRDLARDDNYSYDSPVIHQFPEPVEVRPGDTLLTTCVYRSVSKKVTTFYGEGTGDEMCYSFFTFYPLSHVTKSSCATWDDVDMCKFDRGMLNGCDVSMFRNTSRPDTKALISKILDNCSVYGGCRSECPAAVAEVLTHPCMTGKMRYLNYDFLRTTSMPVDIMKFFAALDSCECQNTKVGPWPQTSSAAPASVPAFVVILLALLSIRTLC